MSRILVSANTAWNAHNFRAGLLRALIGAGHEVTVAAPPDESAKELERLGCRFLPLPMDSGGTSARRDLDLVRRYIGAMRAVRPNVYLGYTIKPNVYGSLAAHYLGVPAINNVSGLGTAFIRDTWLTGVVKGLYKIALSRSHTVFFQNADDRDLFISRRLVAEPRTALLPGSGIDLVHFSPAGLPPPRDETVFLLIARLLFDKGVGEFVEAARHLKAGGARFQLLGFLDADNQTAVPRNRVEAWVREGLVEYLGAHADVRPFIAAADCVVLPSYREGTPHTLLEAAAMGRPLIATNVPGCRDVVDDNVNGLLCAARDGADLAGKMRAFIDMPPRQREEMGQRGRAKMERQFDEAIVISRYFEAIARATANQGRAAA